VSERRGRLLVDGRLAPGTVRFEDGLITAVDLDWSEGAGAELPLVAPGLIDLHVHGYGGCEPVGDLGGMARALAAAGTTAFQPTLFPSAPERLGAEAEGVWRAAAALGEGAGACPVGLHLEGPFVNPRAAGALPKDGLAEPSLEALRDLLGPSGGDARGIRTMTLAPELPGAPALVEELVRCGVRVSLGHSLATASEARSAGAAGAAGATHLYNAMRGLHHREAGLVGFALSDDVLCAELIGDLVHVGPEAVELALRARGPDGLALVSDALAGAGSGCDVFESHGHTCAVRDGAIWIEDPDAPGGARLTGAAASQLEAVRRLTAAGVVSVPDALTMASATPARALGLEAERGRLVPGARADLIVLAGPGLELVEVLIAGRSASP
jgi:N-acetylglucosamine-6-phosphate deacetylase